MAKRKLTYKDFLNYFGNNLQNNDKHDFEKEMMRDSFEEEAFDGLSKLSKAEIEDDLRELRDNINEKAQNRRSIIPVWFRYAASVVVLIGIGISIVYLNSNYWQDSMLKEQISNEMEIADSMVFEAEKQLQASEQKIDTIKQAPEQLIAESKDSEEEKREKYDKVELLVVEDDVVIEDELIMDADTELGMDDMMEVLEFEEEEEIVEDEAPMMAVPQAEAPAKIEEVVLADKKEDKSTERAKKSKVRIRGATTTGKEKAPLYVIDGKQVDLSNTITIEGKILGADDEVAIPGVSVVVEDMEVFGTTTDIDGNFSLIIPDDEELKTLIASFVGMETQKIELENDSNLLVYLEASVMEMDEVIVTAYGAGDKDYEVPAKVQAQPPGSITKSKYKKQILEQLDYSLFSDYAGKHRVKVSFNVNQDGSLSNFNCRNIPGIVFCDEIRRVILEMGEWEPATEGDNVVSSIVTLNLRIDMKE